MLVQIRLETELNLEIGALHVASLNGVHWGVKSLYKAICIKVSIDLIDS